MAAWGGARRRLYVVPALTAIAAVPVLGQSLKPGVIAGLVLGLIGFTWSAAVALAAGPRPA